VGEWRRAAQRQVDGWTASNADAMRTGRSVGWSVGLAAEMRRVPASNAASRPTGSPARAVRPGRGTRAPARPRRRPS